MAKFNKNTTTPKAKELIRLYAEYVEGHIESAKDKYELLLNITRVSDLLYMIYHTPFEKQSIDMYNHLVKNDINIPITVYNKVLDNKMFLAKLEQNK